MDRDEGESPIKLYTAWELTGLQPPQYLVEGLIERRSLSLLAAPSGGGKSHVAVDLACSIAMGRKFANRHAVRQAPVFYLAAEGGRSLQKRIVAWTDYHNVKLQDLPVYFIINPVRLREEDQMNQLLEALDTRIDGERVNPELLIIDTLSQSFGSGDENTMDMQEFCDCMAQLRDHRDMAVMVIHHMNAQGSRERGHTSLKAAMDHSFKIMGVRGPGGKGLKKILFYNDKNKDDIEAEKLVFRVEDYPPSIILKPEYSSQLSESSQIREDEKLMRLLANIEAVEGDTLHAYQWKKLTGLEPKYFYQAVDTLLDTRLIKKAGHGKYYLTAKGLAVKDQNRRALLPFTNIDVEEDK